MIVHTTDGDRGSYSPGTLETNENGKRMVRPQEFGPIAEACGLRADFFELDLSPAADASLADRVEALAGEVSELRAQILDETLSRAQLEEAVQGLRDRDRQEQSGGAQQQ